MKIIENNLIPFKGFTAINIFGFIFVRKGTFVSDRTKNHELIHSCQIEEVMMFCIPIVSAAILIFGISWWWLLRGL
jgi:hypothetical protein